MHSSTEPTPVATRHLGLGRPALDGLNAVERLLENASSDPSNAIPSSLHELQRSDLHGSSGRLRSLEGRRISHYELGERIGAGGMGQVFQARHIRLGKTFAVKFLSSDALLNDESHQRFLQEIQAIGQLNHPNIVAAVDAGCERGIVYYATELLQGHDLDGWVNRKGLPPPGAVCEMIRQAAIGLHHAHERGFVHRDIKPSNLFLDVHGTIKILDFGLVRSRRADQGLTTPNCLMGSVDFLPPEQAEDPSKANPQSDLYSLGATWIYLLSGQAPFPDATHPTVVSKLRGHLIDVPAYLRSAPSYQLASQNLASELIPLLESLVAKSPADRPATAKQVAESIKKFADAVQLGEWMGSAKPISETCSNLASEAPSASSKSPTRAGSRNRLRGFRPVVVLIGMIVVAGLGILAFPKVFHRTSRGSLPDRLETSSSIDPSGTVSSNHMDNASKNNALKNNASKDSSLKNQPEDVSVDEDEPASRTLGQATNNSPRSARAAKVMLQNQAVKRGIDRPLTESVPIRSREGK